MELQLFKEIFEKNLEGLEDYLLSIKHRIFTPQPDENQEFTTYADEEFESFYRHAYIQLTNVSGLVDKVYKFIVSNSEAPGCPDRPEAQSELFNCFDNINEELRVINERLLEVYETLTGRISEDPDASYNLNSVDGYTNFISDKVKSATILAKDILEFITYEYEIEEIEPAPEEIKTTATAADVIVDKLDYCD